jgi:hypothetical protein
MKIEAVVRSVARKIAIFLPRGGAAVPATGLLRGKILALFNTGDSGNMDHHRTIRFG